MKIKTKDLTIKGKKADLNYLCAEIFAVDMYIKQGEISELKSDEYPLSGLVHIAYDIYDQLNAVGYYNDCSTRQQD